MLRNRLWRTTQFAPDGRQRRWYSERKVSIEKSVPAVDSFSEIHDQGGGGVEGGEGRGGANV